MTDQPKATLDISQDDAALLLMALGAAYHAAISTPIPEDPTAAAETKAGELDRIAKLQAMADRLENLTFQ